MNESFNGLLDEVERWRRSAPQGTTHLVVIRDSLGGRGPEFYPRHFTSEDAARTYVDERREEVRRSNLPRSDWESRCHPNFITVASPIYRVDDAHMVDT